LPRNYTEQKNQGRRFGNIDVPGGGNDRHGYHAAALLPITVEDLRHPSFYRGTQVQVSFFTLLENAIPIRKIVSGAILGRIILIVCFYGSNGFIHEADLDS